MNESTASANRAFIVLDFNNLGAPSTNTQVSTRKDNGVFQMVVTNHTLLSIICNFINKNI